MFKSARWRSEKNKFKAVFKLQFRVTQLPPVAGDALLISLVPADVGKPTVKSERATVRNGGCLWENPVYETVKFSRDPKSGKIHERIYFFVVGTGSSKGGVIGEASIDFSAYTEEKVSSVSLPLKYSSSGAILSVSIQRIQESVDQRDIEESELTRANSQDRSLKAQLSNGDINEIIGSNSVDDLPSNKNVGNVAELNGNRRTSSGSDLTLSSSGSSFGVDTSWEPQMTNHHEPGGFSPSLSHSSGPQQPKAIVQNAMYEEHPTSQWEWLGNPALEASIDDSLRTPRETLLKECSNEASDLVIEKLKADLSVLSRQAEMSELELQTLRKQIVKESRRGQDLSREVSCLREERDVLREECKRLKAFQMHLDDGKMKNNFSFEGLDSHALVDELRQELNHAKDLNANLHIQLKKTQESNSELILAVRDLDEMLEQKNRELVDVANRHELAAADGTLHKDKSKHQMDHTDEDEEQMALEELVKEHRDAKETYLLEQQIIDIRSEIEIYKRDKDELEMQLEQLALDYEIMKQENHDMSYKLEQGQLQEQLKMQYECSSSYVTVHELEVQIENLENELKTRSQEFSNSLVIISNLKSQIGSLENDLKVQSTEFSQSSEIIRELEAQIRSMENQLEERSKEFTDSLVTISELKARTRSLEEELEKQAQGFEADLESLTHSKIEQEHRAIRAEEALRKMRWQNANTAERLQEEFRRLSQQMASTLEANEKLAAKALTEATELRMQKIHLEEIVQKASEELQLAKELYEARLKQLSDQVILMTTEIEQLQLETEDRMSELKKQKKTSEEAHRLLKQEVSMLKAEIETCKAENGDLLVELGHKRRLTDELEKMRKSSEEIESLVEQGNKERSQLQSAVALMEKEVEESHKELNRLRCLLDEKESIIESLTAEVDTLKYQHEELKNIQSNDLSEKEKLRTHVIQLKGVLKKKEEVFISMERKIKDNNSRETTFDGVKAASKTNNSALLPHCPKELANLKEKIKFLEGQIKLKETALETSANSFFEKEKDLHNKIEELEARLEVINRSSSNLHKDGFQEVAAAIEDVESNYMLTEVSNAEKSSCTVANSSYANTSALVSVKSNHNDISDELGPSANCCGDTEKLLSETTLLKERNSSMEDELKEMQERYSEISLRFAEVEGERQQLVMKLRTITNAKSS